MMSKEQHVTPKGSLWQVIGAGNTKATKLFDYGREIAKNQKTELVIHNKKGQIRDKDSYGNDNCPPRDTKF